MKNRDNKGRFVRPEYRGLEVKPEKTAKQFPYVECVLGVIAVLGTLILLDHAGVIDVVKLLKPVIESLQTGIKLNYILQNK